MANLYKRKKTIVDPATGKKKVELSVKWWARYRDENDRLRRVSLSTSKTAARKMLTDILEQVERRRAGLEDPVTEASRRPIEQHIDDFENHQKAKNNTPRYIEETLTKIRRCVESCKWLFAHQITASDVEGFLVDLRTKHGLGIQTSNHYLRSIKCFVRWLVVNRRLPSNPLDCLSALNAATDRRHDRRSLTVDEFARVYDVAKNGPPSVGLSGPDRAMLYLLAAWTGLRRGEIGSLTRRSFDFESEAPTVTVAAAYSKHRREDVLILHTDVVTALKTWLALKSSEPDDILFHISERTCGIDRRTSEMLMFDLGVARSLWIAEATTKKDRREREKSDFLRYQDSQGKFADFHSLRHTFVTNLARANVDPKTAQTLARHSDIRLTMNTYTHVDQDRQAAAIKSLPGFEV